ncbi:MAG: hypothetical protein ABI184_09095, partial [Ginsengibacter sp.]
MKENQKKYNGIDFARYLSGTMLPDEMHALEKAALEDPFLSDALDGYRYSKNYEKELGEIRMRLDEKRKQKKVFTISSLSSGTWWKIAAMFILFAGVGYFFYATNSKKENSLALQENEIKKETPTINSPVTNDSNASEGNIAFEKVLPGKDKNDRAKLTTPVAKSIQPAVKNSADEEVRISKEKDFSAEHFKDKKENSVATSIDKTSLEYLTQADSEQKSLLRSSDTTAMVAVPATEYSKDSANAIAMNKKALSLHEVVVTGYGTQRKKNITGTNSEKLEGKASGVDLKSSHPYPKDGKEKFDQYIKDNAIPVLDSIGERIPANIFLSFTLNKRGKPTHIKVIESSCKPCEKEAIKLLKTGPDWMGKPGEVGNVRIQF